MRVTARRAGVLGTVDSRPTNSLADAARALCGSSHDEGIASGNRLMGAHLRAGRPGAAREVFDGMPRRDVVSWNSLMAAHAREGAHQEAAYAFLELRRCRLRPDHTSFSTVLSAVARLEALELGRCVHGLALKACSTGNVFVGASLVTMYASCGVFACLQRVFDGVDAPNVALWNALLSGLVMNHRVADARMVFDQMPGRNVVSWTAMVKGYVTVHEVDLALELFDLMPMKNSVSWCVIIGGLVHHQQFREAIELFKGLMRNGDEVTNAVLVKVVNAYAGLKSIGGGRCIHGFSVKCGFVLDLIIETSLVAMYCNSLDIDEAQLEFDKLDRKHVGSWNAIICGYIYSDKIDEARELFDSMTERDKVSWNSMINGYIRDGRITDATELYSRMPEKNVEAATALMSWFVDNGMLDKARDMFYTQNIFDQMGKRDVVTWNTIIHGYAFSSLGENAIEMFENMKRAQVDPDDITFLGVLSACSHMSLLEEAKHFFNAMTRDHGIVPNITHYACMVDLFCRRGMVEEAEGLMKSMPFEPDSAIWTSLLSSCRLSGNDKLAEHAASQLIAINPVLLYFTNGRSVWYQNTMLYTVRHSCYIRQYPRCSP
ncbi:unnamed protein product [Triticum turgidum subsp. durum]|uniref:Pentatricopeptide repeat-containing protein n=1 Tax=Triticum turgidum subsp. durum TaxID=4567 RepID=A0A9R0Z2B0_TRITD|nr:unnamed protein product [Triticum turgidum subsp. durum]